MPPEMSSLNMVTPGHPNNLFKDNTECQVGCKKVDFPIYKNYDFSGLEITGIILFCAILAFFSLD